MNFKRFHESKNLFDKTSEYTVGETTYNYTISGLDPNKDYTCSTNFVKTVETASVYFNGGVSGFNGVWSDTPRTSKPDSNGDIIVYIRRLTMAGAPAIYDDVMAGTIWVMVNEGSTPLPYEPHSSEVWHDTPHYIHNTSTDTLTTPAVLYPNDTTATVGLKGNMSQSGTPTPTTPIQPSECGDLETSGEKAGQYKIPISSANTTTPIYLGEIPTTRYIKKLMFDGTENWRLRNDTAHLFYLILNTMKTYSPCMASHYKYRNRSTAATMLEGEITTGLGAGVAIWIKSDTHTTAADFKSYLQQQYAAGTPVTIWYVLAEPTTGIVNEPIRKIGDYADSLTTSIPCTAGENTLDVQTTVQPSEVSVNYKGWHPVQSVHEAENGQWD